MTLQNGTLVLVLIGALVEGVQGKTGEMAQ